MYRDRISTSQLRSLYKPNPLYGSKKNSMFYSREGSPRELQTLQSYHVPQFANQSYKASQKPRNRRAHQNTSFDAKMGDYCSKMQRSERKAEKKIVEQHCRTPKYQKENRVGGYGYNHSKNESFKTPVHEIVIDQEQIFSFKELVQPPKQSLTGTRKINTNLSSPVARNSTDFKKTCFDFMNTTGTESKSRLSEFGKKKPTEKDFAAIKILGKGKYSKSFLVRQKRTNFICVLKQISKEIIKKNNMIDRVTTEIKAHMCLKHPNIIQFYGLFETQTDICLILQYGEEGKLTNIIKRVEEVPEALISHYAYDICMALEYIHSKKVLHRDIRPDNVILSNGVVKLYDFSWATSISPKKAVFCGTVGYAPPEVSELNQYNESIDLWGLGVILYELATGRVWISSVEESLHNKMMRRQLELPSKLSTDLKDLIQGLLRKDPMERMTLMEVWRHPFIKKYNK